MDTLKEKLLRRLRALRLTSQEMMIELQDYDWQKRNFVSFNQQGKQP